ncbi:MAG: Fpg/Nei family DNA glycosylase [Candidatus Izimaplasma sp.]|nr:Fpg/Nei family DNA glycosylase [Candidatus Izimaplasma bacterium]
MPELPEIHHLKDQLKDVLINQIIQDFIVYQPKSINISKQTFLDSIKLKHITEVQAQGKWLFIILETKDKIAINLGMGGEITYLNHALPKKHQVEIHLANDMRLNIRFWWFGHVHLIQPKIPHKYTDKLGIDYFNETCNLAYFLALLKNRRGSLKNFLLNQSYISGIGNYYIHDILFLAKLHPKRTIPSLTLHEKEQLYHAIQAELKNAYQQNGSFYEEDIFQQKGNFKADKVAYKEDELCKCQHVIKKIKTGQTTSYFCPNCQK